MAQTLTLGVNILAYDKASKPLQGMVNIVKTLQSQIRKSTTATHDFGQGVEKVSESIQMPKDEKDTEGQGGKPGGNRFFKGSQDFGQGVQNLSRSLKDFLFLLVGAGGTTYAVKRFSESLSGSLVDLHATARRLGVPIEQLRRMAYVAEAANVSSESFITGLKKLKEAQFDARYGISSEATKALSALGVSASGTKNILDLLLKASAALVKKVPDPVLRTRIVTQLLGDENLIKLMDLGPAQIQALVQAFKLDPISPDALERAREFNFVSTQLKQELDELKFGVGTDVLKGFSQWLRDVTGQMRENKAETKSFARVFIDDFAMSIRIVSFLLKPVVLMFKELNQVINLGHIAFTAFAGGGIALLLSKLGLLAPLLAALTPYWPILAAVAAITAGAYLLWPKSAYGTEVAPEPRDPGSAKFKAPESLPKQLKSRVESDSNAKDSSKNASLGLEGMEKNLVVIRFENAPANARIVDKRGNVLITTDRGLLLGGAS